MILRIIYIKNKRNKKQLNKIIMKITIAGQTFDFSDASDVRVDGYDLHITEPGFNETSKSIKEQFTSKTIALPGFIEHQVSRCAGLDPCSKVYEDAKGNKKLYTYFD